MMHQYLRIKERYRDAILFRLGDFTKCSSKMRDRLQNSRYRIDIEEQERRLRVPLCGVPYHSAEPYIRKLLDAGHKVAVCEQVEDPKTAKGVVQREVVRHSLRHRYERRRLGCS
jgi:DNA mismatch repair protein MutS